MKTYFLFLSLLFSSVFFTYAEVYDPFSSSKPASITDMYAVDEYSNDDSTITYANAEGVDSEPEEPKNDCDCSGFDFIRSVSVGSEEAELWITKDANRKKYCVKYDGKAKCSPFIGVNADAQKMKNAINQALHKIDVSKNVNDVEMVQIAQDELTNSFNAQISNLAAQIDAQKTPNAGVFVIAENFSAKVYDCITGEENETTKKKHIITDSIYIRVFNNRIEKIKVIAHFENNPKEVIYFENYSHSIPINFLKRVGQNQMFLRSSIQRTDKSRESLTEQKIYALLDDYYDRSSNYILMLINDEIEKAKSISGYGLQAGIDRVARQYPDYQFMINPLLKMYIYRNGITQKIPEFSDAYLNGIPPSNFKNRIVDFNNQLKEILSSNSIGCYKAEVSEIITYIPAKDSFTNAIKNTEFTSQPGKKTVKSRDIYDYVSLQIFSDFLGLNTDNSNRLIWAEGYAKVPLNLINYKKTTYLSALTAEMNVAMVNGLNTSDRILELDPVYKTDQLSTFLNDTIALDIYDAWRYNNLNFRTDLAILSFEFPELSTNFNLEIGTNLSRSTVQYKNVIGDDEDEIEDLDIFMVIPEFRMNAEIRPQVNFGSDVNIALRWLNYEKDIEDKKIFLLTNYNYFDSEALTYGELADKASIKNFFISTDVNFYWKTNPNKNNAGMYFRLAGDYHYASDRLFPQALVGYATNLSSFVNYFENNNLSPVGSNSSVIFPSPPVSSTNTSKSITNDVDVDGVPNDSDNCPINANPNQEDFDNDKIGDACDNDIDGDGVLNSSDKCPKTKMGDTVDSNGCSD